MPDATILFAITPLPQLSPLVWVSLGLAAMYLARRPFHQVMQALERLIYNAMRLAAASVRMSRHRLESRNREVLLTAGIEKAERQSEHQLERISAMVHRRLADYPQLERRIRENLQKMEDDYRKTAEIPQGLSDWVKIIDAIAGIQPAGDPMVVKALEDIHITLKAQHEVALEGHRKAVSIRHNILSRMLPQWNATEKQLKRVAASIVELSDRSHAVDRCMTMAEALRSGVDAAERRLHFSSLTQFFFVGLVLAAFTMGAFINFHLIALPMAEIVGGYSYIAGFKTSDVAGMVIVCLQVGLGIFLMDAARVTRIFDRIGGLDDRQRTWLFHSLLAMLLILAGVESSLALIRDRISADMQALRQSLAGMDPPSLAASGIPTIGQMILGFLLPLIISTAAIPMEGFIRSSRTVLGLVSVWALRVIALLLRLTGNLGYYGGRLIQRLYDLIIFPALWLEAQWQCQRDKAKGRSDAAENRAPRHRSTLNLVKETAQCKPTVD